MSKTAALMGILIMAGGGVTSILAAFGAWGEAAALAFVGAGMLIASRVLSSPPKPEQVKVPAAQPRKAELA